MNATILRRGTDGAALYLLNGREEEGLFDALSGCGATLIGLSVEDWNRQLSPWSAQRCFRDGEDFGGGAGEFLAEIAREIPAFEAEQHLRIAKRGICGYSLAGLCALYALYVTDLFCAAACASGSLWFDGWIKYMEENRPVPEEAFVYLSVGDREKRARNPRLCTVEDCCVRARDILLGQGVRAFFETNPGNHFADGPLRLAKGAIRIWNAMRET